MTLDTEVFYPRGGGQPGDQGIISAAPQAYNVVDVRTVDGIARHYLAQNTCELEVGDPVTLHVDPEQRYLHSAYHTAGHLIAHCAEHLNPSLKAIKGHHVPGEAHIMLANTCDDKDTFMQRLQEAVQHWREKDADVVTYFENPDDTHSRMCKIGSFTPTFCGGTHVSRTSHLPNVAITKIKINKAT